MYILYLNKDVESSYACFREQIICDYIWGKAVWGRQVAASWKMTKYDLN